MMQSCVFAVSAAEENKTANFEYDDFSVSYSVTNSYGNTEVVSLTLTNTGNETIEDWMLYFEPNGDIQYVTNATEMTAENGKCISRTMDTMQILLLVQRLHLPML